MFFDFLKRNSCNWKSRKGVVNVNDEIEITGIKDVKTVCTGVEMFRKLLIEVRLVTMLRRSSKGNKKEEVERGQVLAKVQLSLTKNSKQKHMS